MAGLDCTEEKRALRRAGLCSQLSTLLSVCALPSPRLAVLQDWKPREYIRWYIDDALVYGEGCAPRVHGFAVPRVRCSLP